MNSGLLHQHIVTLQHSACITAGFPWLMQRAGCLHAICQQVNRSTMWGIPSCRINLRCLTCVHPVKQINGVKNARLQFLIFQLFIVRSHESLQKGLMLIIKKQ